MRSAIPVFLTLICPLLDCLENVYTSAGKRTLRFSTKVLFWCPTVFGKTHFTTHLQNARLHLSIRSRWPIRTSHNGFLYTQMLRMSFGLVSLRKFRRRICLFLALTNVISHYASSQIIFMAHKFADLPSRKEAYSIISTF